MSDHTLLIVCSPLCIGDDNDSGPTRNKSGGTVGYPVTLAPSRQRQENHVWSQPGLYNKIVLGEGDQHIGDSCSMSMEEAAGLSIRRPFIDTAKIHLTFDGGRCQSHFVCWLLAKLDSSILIRKMWVNYPLTQLWELARPEEPILTCGLLTLCPVCGMNYWMEA